MRINSYHSIFIDFDGTITENDVGYEMFRKFTADATEPLVKLYRDGLMNSRDCLAGECDIWNECSPSNEDVNAYLDAQKLTSGFTEFLTFLKERDIKPYILSEGFSFYIDRILTTHGLSHLKRVTNIAAFNDGRLTYEFPYHKQGCDQCSSCKAFHINQIRPAKLSAIYIGDGHSDLHGARAADIVFARSHLAELLALEDKAFIPYRDFHDIAAAIETIFEQQLFTQTKRLNFCLVSHRHLREIQTLWENGDVMQYVGYPDGLGKTDAYYNHLLDKLETNNNIIYTAIEGKDGAYMGEAKIAFPNDDGICKPDLKLLPEYRGKGFGFEAWNMIIDRTGCRWPDASLIVTPNIENKRAINMYHKLGFKFDGKVQIWHPQADQTNAVPVHYRKMIRTKI